MNKRYLIAMASGALLTASLGVGALTFADTSAGGTAAATGQAPAQHGVGGTVTAVSGNTITVTGQDGKSYTIDAGSATITKDETVGVSDIAVGDTLMADGTVSGTSVTASSIHDGKMPAGGPGFGMGRGPMGDGVHGKVSAVSGNTLTVTETDPRDNTTTTYTVDASNAKVLKGSSGAAPTESTISLVAVGDEVMVMGTKNGTSVTATTVVDGAFPRMGHGQKPRASSTTSTTSSTTAQ